MMTVYIVKYDSNNSGGSWWLGDEDWEKLEKALWKVEWVKDSKDTLFRNGDRFLGALASRASLVIESDDDPLVVFRSALKNFEEVVGTDITDEGCSCCGPPHSFTLYRVKEDGEEEYLECGYGQSLIKYLYDVAPRSFREAVKILNKEE